ncbi:MAG: tRNA 2-thiouridine(34) synthase MnmA [Deltaproteobacteria bacterium]|nr:tRNA 2-thiouridine(34) synthase MnmA [Deltaproteobacteria bacterium]
MSGGVDSSVAAALLKEKGYEVIGVSMRLLGFNEDKENGCCSLNDLNDARSVAYKLDIPYYVLNMEEVFSKEVISYFVEGYLKGETPNPCIRCNQTVKFKTLLKKAEGLGAISLATGHYARIVNNGAYRLLKGIDTEKDQSYFLFTMTQGELSKTIFPLGGLTKKEVRKIAKGLGLKTAEKKESQEICFVTDGAYADIISNKIEMQEGPIVDLEGNCLGAHKGLFRYTIGQRHGLGIGGPKGPYYVIDMDLSERKLIVGPEKELYSKTLIARDLNWINGVTTGAITAKIRYKHPDETCEVRPLSDNKALVEFSNAQRAIAPGQAIVFYRGEEMLGGGWIEEKVR